jgi:integrase
MTRTRHTSAEFLRFLDRLVATQPTRQAIHIIADNLSAHKTKAVRDQKLLAGADRVGRDCRFALVLAHETGHRIGAIRLLRWSDVDLERATIRWRAENDRIGFSSTRRPGTSASWAAGSRCTRSSNATSGPTRTPRKELLGRQASNLQPPG